MVIATSESLEPRRLFYMVAVSPSLYPFSSATMTDKGKLVIVMGSNDLSIARNGAYIEVAIDAHKTHFAAGVVGTFNPYRGKFRGVRSISVTGTFDADRIAIGPSVHGALIYGGASDDTIFGDDNADTMYGGAGNDQIHGGGGDDELFGEGGKDHLYGDGGDDRLDGGASVDHLDGGSGANTLAGGAGLDYLTLRSTKDKTNRNDLTDRLIDQISA